MNTGSLIIIFGILILVLGSLMLLNQNTSNTTNLIDGQIESTEDGVDETTESSSQETPVNTKGTTKTDSTESLMDKIDLPLQSGFITVRYTDNGFVPKTVIITQGSSVQFINDSNKAMLIRAVPAESYGAFSQTRSNGKGGIFTFGFHKPGTWSYGNLNNLDDTGIVLVIEQ
jgi:plastocyanin